MPELDDADAGADDAVETKETPEVDADEADTEEEADALEGDEAEDSEEEVAPKRGETRFQKLANETRVERERRIALETENRMLRESRTAQPDNSGEAARIKAEKRALMTPEERKIDELEERLQRTESAQGAVYWQGQDTKDEAQYDKIAAKDTVQGRYFEKNRERVERELQAARSKGNWQITRGAIASLMFSQDAFNAKPSKKLAAKKAEAAGRVDGAKAKSVGGRGDIGGGKGGKEESLDDLKARILAQEGRR